ncbi:MAG: alpha/beta fold hydrolase [Bacillota bacterium]|nr:alpha/beta fold hydrolase [Bacillota bacterium]
MTGKRKILKRLGITLLAGLALLPAALVVIVHLSVTGYFKRGDYKDYATTKYGYEHYRDAYPREELSFSVGKNELRAYLYGGGEAERLLVFCHGMGSGHEEYLNEIIHMVDRGYAVFAHDGTGSGTSGGDSVRGLLQSAIDLETALAFIDTLPELGRLPKYLMGHSWGAFAVAEAAGCRDDLVAVASIAGYAYPGELLSEQASEMLGLDLSCLGFFFDTSQLLSFGPQNYRRNAVDSINRSTTPILLIHGSDDEMIPADSSAIVAHRDELTNPNVEILILDREGQNGHNTIFRPTEALSYIARKNREYAALCSGYDGPLPSAVRENYIRGVDLDLVNQVNGELFGQIEAFFDQAASRP